MAAVTYLQLMRCQIPEVTTMLRAKKHNEDLHHGGRRRPGIR